MFCRKCGKEIKNDAIFCTNCGHKVVQTNKNEKENQATKQNNKIKKKPVENGKKFSRKVLFIPLGIILVIGLVIGIYFINSQKDDKELEQAEGRRLIQGTTTIDDKVEKYNEQLTNFKTASINYIMSDEEKLESDNLISDYEAALNDLNIDKSEECFDELEKLDGELISSSEITYENLLQNINSFDKSIMYDIEKDVFGSLVEEANELYSESKYLLAYEKLGEGEDLYNISLSSKNYSLEIEQVDVSNYPMISLYIQVVNLVTGEVVETLNTEQFHIREKTSATGVYEEFQLNKVAQLNEEENLNIDIVADVSSSMGDYGIYEAQNAMHSLINAIQFNVGDQVALLSFSDYVQREMPFTNNETQIRAAVDNLWMGNLTAFYDALYTSVSQTAMEEGAKCIIAFTDGSDNISTVTPQAVIDLAAKYKIPIFIIGIGDGLSTYELENIAGSSGGFYININEIVDIVDIYHLIFKEQKSQYVLEYQTNDTISEIINRDIYVNYNSDSVTARNLYTYTPSDFMEATVSYAQINVNGFVFQDSDSRYLTVADLRLLSDQELRIARNEIYARRGRKFTDTNLRNHFNGCSWYRGTIEADNFSESVFNEYERANAYFIREFENLYGLNQ